VPQAAAGCLFQVGGHRVQGRERVAVPQQLKPRTEVAAHGRRRQRPETLPPSGGHRHRPNARNKLGHGRQRGLLHNLSTHTQDSHLPAQNGLYPVQNPYQLLRTQTVLLLQVEQD